MQTSSIMYLSAIRSLQNSAWQRLRNNFHLTRFLIQTQRNIWFMTSSCIVVHAPVCTLNHNIWKFWRKKIWRNFHLIAGWGNFDYHLWRFLAGCSEFCPLPLFCVYGACVDVFVLAHVTQYIQHQWIYDLSN